MNAAAVTTRTTKKSSKARKPATDPTVPFTLKDLADQYVRHLVTEGKSLGTQFAYRMELNTAVEELGASTPITALTTDQVGRFFESERVTKTRSGRAKAKPTIDKTRRVLRLALTWAVEQRLIEQAPLPDAAAQIS